MTEFRQLAACMESSHAVVAERTLYLYNNEAILSHIVTQKETIFPLIFGPLVRNSTGTEPNSPAKTLGKTLGNSSKISRSIISTTSLIGLHRLI